MFIDKSSLSLLQMKVLLKAIFAIALLFSTTGIQAQTDSLWAEISKLPDSEEKIFALINLSNKVMTDDPVGAMDVIGHALELAYKFNNERAEAYCYNTVAALNYQLKLEEVAITNYHKAIKLFKKLGEDKGLYISYKYLAAAYDAKADYNNSLKYHFIFVDKASAKGDSADIIESFDNIARIYYNLEKFDDSEHYYKKVLAYHKYHNNEDDVVEATNDLGLVQLQQNKVTEAMDNFNGANEIAQRTGNRRGEANSYSNMSQAYGKQKNKRKQIEMEQQALNTNVTYNNPDLAMNNNWNMAQTYIADNNTHEAIPHLCNSIDLSVELGDLKFTGEAYQALTDAYEQQGDYDKALDTYKQYLRVVDSLKSAQEEENLAAIRLSTDLSRSEERIALLEAERKMAEQEMEVMRSREEVARAGSFRQKVIIWSLTGGMGLLALSALFVYRSSRQKRKANQLLALQSLRSQMNPHFIFNALNSVNSFISMNDERSANKYLSDFSRLMRSVMENSKHDFVTLRSELEILKLYTRLEHFRFSDKFDYTFEVDEDIQEDLIEIPPMLIQPYIENSVWHGLRYKEEKGHLWIKFSQEADHLAVTIEDDGIGRERSQEMKTRNQKETKSTGMRNIDQRLNIINELHGTKLDVAISDRDVHAEDKGTFVKIRIPFNETEA